MIRNLLARDRRARRRHRRAGRCRAAQGVAAASATLPASNPFAKPSTLPFETPDFAQIKDSDYLPALLAGMAQQKREVTAIANQTAAPTFDNTVVAMERSGPAARAREPRVQGGQRREHQRHAAGDRHQDRAAVRRAQRLHLSSTPKLFQRFKYLHDHQAELNLNPEQAKLLDVYYKQFVHAGAELPAGQAGRSSRRSTSG